MSTPAFAGGPAVAGLHSGVVLLDRYELRERLERGTPDHADSGAVWRAHDLLLRRDVALRSLRTSAGRDPVEARERAHREGRAAARVHHPGLAAIYDMADLDGDVVLVTELLRGPSLAQVLATTGRLPHRRTASVGTQLADGLAAAHVSGVVHGDVGPATVLLGVDDDGHLDDGAALAGLGVAGADGLAEGVPGRLRAPETLHGAPVSPAADVWALGATLHLAVTGRPPGPGGADRAAGPLAGLLAAMLAPDPAARPDAGQVRVALEGVVDALADADVVTSAAAVPPTPPASPVAAPTPADGAGPGPVTTPDLPAVALNPPTRTWTPRTDPRPAARHRRRLVQTGVVGAGLLAVGAVGVAATSLPDTAPAAGTSATLAAPPAPLAPAVDAPITPVEPEPPISAVPLDADPVLTAATEDRRDRAERREREARAERREEREEREDRRERAREDRDDDRDRGSDRSDREDRDDRRRDRDSDRDSDRDDDSDRGDRDSDRGDSDD